MAKGNKGKQQQQQANGSATGAGAAKSPSTNGHHSKASASLLVTTSDDEHTESADYDEISSSNSATQNQAPDDDIDHEKVEAFRRIASAEEIEEMSDELLENHVDLASLSPERRAKVEEELKKELAKTEEEIQTLRQVLNAKVKHSHELKRKLGITVWKEFREDMEQNIRNIQETSTYQKTTDVVKAASEKTTSMIGTFGGSVARKLGEVKNSNAFKSFEERVGYAVTNVKSKISSRSNSTTNFDDALRNSESMAGNGSGGGFSSTTPITSPTIPEDKPLA
ncbi:PREDICTED: tumor protein D52-like [Rhagoletis zephyria]|uniref:tumor protein D52-like n=1 Tax=Rhagoletis zephyria TaxID=28612 RepID=UPI0008114EA7|nr:PREDICTED: tumor protein D52-like [Rhagoletis zephyria]